MALTIVALLFVWVALVAPDHPARLTPSTFLRLPLEGIAVLALALALPAKGGGSWPGSSDLFSVCW